MPSLLCLLCLLCAGSLCATDDEYKDLPGLGNTPDDRAMAGGSFTPPSSETQRREGIDPDKGVEVGSTYPGTAIDGKIPPGAVITAINGNQTNTITDLRNEVSLIGVGGDATFTYSKDGVVQSATVTLGSWPKNIPFEPIDDAAERRFRDWQKRRLDRTQQAVSSLRKQVEDIERRTQNEANASASPTGPLPPALALALPASKALAALPAFRLRLHQSHDTADSSTVLASGTVAWDARVLVGSPAPTIY